MKHAHRLKSVAAALLLALAGGTALAQGAAGSTGQSEGAAGSTGAAAGSGTTAGSASAKDSLSAAERNFLLRAASDGMFELEAARLAADQAKDEAVKRYAAMLVEQHSSAHQELASLAQSKGLSLPTNLSGGKRRQLDRLKRAKGEEFDAIFVQTVGVRDHRGDVNRYRNISRTAKDADVKAWATKMLPSLEQHMSEARSLPAAKQPRIKTPESTP